MVFFLKWFSKWLPKTLGTLFKHLPKIFRGDYTCGLFIGPSSIATRFFGDTIFLILDILTWIVLTILSTAFYWMAWEYYDYYMDCPKIQIFMAVCGFSMLLEILGTIWKQRICMIVVCILTANLCGFSTWYWYCDCTCLTDDSRNLALVASVWNIVRFVNQIIDLIWRIDAKKNSYAPLLAQTINQYQSI